MITGPEHSVPIRFAAEIFFSRLFKEGPKPNQLIATGQPNSVYLEPTEIYEEVHGLGTRLREGLSKIPEVQAQAAERRLGIREHPHYEFLLDDKLWLVTVRVMGYSGDIFEEYIEVQTFKPHPVSVSDPEEKPDPVYALLEKLNITSIRPTDGQKPNGSLVWTEGNSSPVTNRGDLFDKAQQLLAPILSLTQDQNSG